MERSRSPMMTAPDRSKSSVAYSPKIPVSLKREAESVVIQRAKELVTRHPEIPDMQPLADSLRVLKLLDGGR